MASLNNLRGNIQKLFSKYTSLPPNIDKADERAFLTFIMINPVVAANHALITILFYYLDIMPGMFFNIGSVIAWITALVILRKGKLLLAVSICFAEVTLFTVSSVYLVGWDFGFQLYIIGFLLGLHIIKRRYRFKIIWSVIFIAVLAGMYFYSRSISPAFFAEPSTVTVIYIINLFIVLLSYGLTGVFMSNSINWAENKLNEEKQRSDVLLKNILPELIAERLKRNPEVIADSFDQASILFADICNFTEFSEKVTPEELVQHLNNVFSRLDDLSEKYGLEKIKTIGDAYMVVSGIPSPREDHAEVLADFALEATRELADYQQEPGKYLQLRIGIHSGEAVAGVIGKRKFAYDLWGDTVNTASRMESHGVPGRIQVSEVTYKRLKQSHQLEERGEIEIKGKGPMRTYFLNGKLD